MKDPTAQFKRVDEFSDYLSPTYFDDRYELVKPIGRGRESIVYQAQKFNREGQLDINDPEVALKIIQGVDKDPERAMRRVQRESLALLSCTHPSIIKMLDYASRKDACYLSLEYAGFGDMKQLLASTDRFLTPRSAFKIIQAVLEGLEVVHDAGIIHRDIKPENLLLTKEYQIKVADFSVCLLQGEKQTLQVVNDIVGTLDYLAPEALRGKGYSVSSDLFSVGVTCFEFVNNQLPFDSQSVKDSLERKQSGSINPCSTDVLEWFPSATAFFKKALAPNPEHRFQSAREMHEAISQVLDGSYRNTKIHSRVRQATDEILQTVSDMSNNLIGTSHSKEEIDQYEFSGATEDQRLSRQSLFKRLHHGFVSKLEFVLARIGLNRLRSIILKFTISILVSVLGITLIAYGAGSYINIEKIKNYDYAASADEVLALGSQFLSGLDLPYIDRFLNPEDVLTRSHKAFVAGSGMGELKDLYSEGKYYRFAIAPVDEHRVLFSLLVKGWAPVEVSTDSIKTDGRVSVIGEGLEITLHIESMTGGVIKGTYDNHISKSKSTWEFRVSE